MLSDRPYMRDEYPRPSSNLLAWLISATVACFVLQFVFLRWFDAGNTLDSLLALSVSNIKAGKVWTLLTYSLLHDTNNLLHIVANLLGLYFLGRILEPLLGAKRFFWLYAGAIIAGGGLWLATHWYSGSGLVFGASAGVAGLFVVFACFYPDQPVTFLLFFILPVTLKPKYAAFALCLIELLGFCFYEVMGAVSPFGSQIAHSAHLGGMAAGWIYFRYLHDIDWRKIGAKPVARVSREISGNAQAANPATGTNTSANSRDRLRAEVDRILDKINSKGFGALSTEEKRVLDEAKELIKRR